jgi:MFS family permease
VTTLGFRSGVIKQFLRRHAIDTRPLRNPPYRRLFVGQAVSGFGLQFTAVAVPVQMYALTGSSLWVGLLGIANLVPLVVFSLWGGAFADAVDRRRLLLGASLLMWCSTLALLAAAALGLTSPALLLALTAVQATGFAVSSPTRGAIIPRLVPTHEVAAANALGTTSFSLAMAAGPLAAGLLIARGQFALAYLVDAVAFTVVLWATWRLPTLRPKPIADADAVRAESLTEAVAADGVTTVVAPPRAAGWREVRAGLAYIVSQPVLWLSFAIDIAAMVLAMPRALFPEVADERFGVGSIGWLYAAIAIGSVVAGLTSGWVSRVQRQGVALVTAVVLWGLAVAAAGLAHSLWLAVVLLAMGGAADLVSSVYRQTILQTYAPDGFQGRLQGVFIAVVVGGPRLGDLRAGTSAALVGTTAAWVGGGVASALVAVALPLAFPALLRYTPRQRSD